MSAETIARWNAIPLSRKEPEVDASQAMKRARPEDDDDSEDNVPLVSRSPSPEAPPDGMDIDKYDEYVKKPQRETVTVDTKIKSSNKGFLMLAKLGWVEGQPLGLSGDGRVDPVPFYVKNDLTGLGKTNQDVRMIETTVAQRRELDSERQTKETEEQRRAREDLVARRAAVQSEISTTLKAFYCELCDKQFQNVAQYDEHTNSYAHHHKARFRDMQLAARASRHTQEELDRRKEKERKREEKELRKVAKAAGIKITKPPVSLISPAPTSVTAASTSATDESKASGFKKTGWASIGSSTALNNSAFSGLSTSGSSKGGWASVGTASSGSQSQESRPYENRGGWAPVSAPLVPSDANPSPPAPRRGSGPAPAFRTGGWTSLDTGSIERAPPPPSAAPPVPPSAPLPYPPVPTPPVPSPPSIPAAGGRSLRPVSGFAAQPSLPGWRSASPQASAGRPSNLDDVDGAPMPHSRPVPSPYTQPPPARPEASRSGWQQFRAGAPGRRR